MKYKGNHLLPIFLIFPPLILVSSLIIFPLVYSFYLSLTDYELFAKEATHFIWFKNYVEALLDPVFRQALINTLLILLIGVNVELLLGFGIALLLEGVNNERIRAFLRSAFMVPIMLPPVVVGLYFRYFFDDLYGPVNALLFSLGAINAPIHWLVDLPMISILIAEIWENTPIMFLILFAGLHALPKTPFEAAEIDGASNWAKFRHVTLPLMKGIILIAMLIRSIDAVRIFDIVMIMTGGGPAHASEVIGTLVYRTAITDFRFAYGAAVSYLSILITIAFAIYLFSQIRKVTE